MNESEYLAKVASLLEPYLENLVVIGGFAVELFHHHPMIRPAAERILTTHDLDLAAPEDLQILGGQSLKDRLVGAGFTERLRGDTHPPFSELEPPDAWGTGYGVELLVPLMGPKEKAVTEVHGFGAAKLRYVDLLLRDPWLLTAQHDPALSNDLSVRVAHPAAYLAQKLLTVGDRANPAKQRKDRAYCYSVVARADDRAALGRETLRRAEQRRGQAVRNLRARSCAEFGAPTSRGARDAARYLGRRAVTASRVHQVMADFLAGLDAQDA